MKDVSSFAQALGRLPPDAAVIGLALAALALAAFAIHAVQSIAKERLRK